MENSYNATEKELVMNGLTLGYVQMKSSGYGGSSFLMFCKETEAHLYNKTATSSAIVKIEVVIPGGASPAAKYYVSLGAEALAGYRVSKTEATGNNLTITLEASAEAGYKYFNISADPSTAKNGQVQKIIITLADGTTVDPDQPVVKPEPAATNKTVAELIALENEMDATYKVTGKVVLWGNKLTSTDTAPTKYGNFVLEGEDGSQIVVYGTTATASTIVWNGETGTYSYKNAQDFLTNELTANLAIGDVVELLVLRTSYNGNPQLNAVLVSSYTPVAEPEATEKTVAELIALENEMDASYKVTGKVVLWGNSLTSTATEPTKYGNFVLEGEDGSRIVVYGATTTAAALAWDGKGAYTYKNAQDFLTNELTASIALGDTVELLVVRTSYKGNPQLNAIVLNVVKGETPEPPVHEHVFVEGKCECGEVDPEYVAPEQPEVVAKLVEVTSVDQLKEGTKLVITYTNANGETFAMGSNDGSKYLKVDLDLTAGLAEGVEVVTLVKAGENWMLQLADGQYVAYSASTGGNKAQASATADAEAQWTIAIVDGVTTITNVATPERLFQYNASSPRFACYKGTVQNPTLYIAE